MRNYYISRSVILLSIVFGCSSLWSQVTTFDYTGTVQYYTVPPGAGSIMIEAAGAEGGDGTGGTGGLGATMIGTFAVTPGEELTVVVGEAGMLWYNAGGGGGGTGVIDEAGDPMIVAGGGGGGGVNSSGYGGQITEAGGNSSGAGGTGGNGGEKGYRSGDCGWSAGGGGFYGDGYGGNGDWDGGALPGTLGGVGAGESWLSGGAAGVNGGCSFSYPNQGAWGCGGGGAGSYGGGGGGGYSGGGGGQYVDPDIAKRGGGGGGSFNDGTDQDNTPGNHAGNGQVIITVLCSPLTITVSDYEICLGEELTLHAESGEGGEITWTGGIEDDVPFTPDEAGVYTYTAMSDAEDDCDVDIEITVYESPIVIAGAGDGNFCIDETVTLSAAGGAEAYEWSPTDLEPGLGTHTYTLTGTSEIGCVGTDEVTVTVHDLPTVSGSSDYDEICVGKMITLTGAGAETYVWDMGVMDGVPHVPGAVGVYTYTVLGTDEYGCENWATVDVTVVEALDITSAITVDEIIGSDGSIDVTVEGGVTPYSFDWDNDGLGDWDDPEDLTGLTGGTYKLYVQGATGCMDSLTREVNAQMSIDPSDNRIVSIYPNPTNDQVNITLDGSFTFSIVSTNGQVLLTDNAVNTTQVDLSDFADGVYVVQVQSGDAQYTLKLTKQ